MTRPSSDIDLLFTLRLAGPMSEVLQPMRLDTPDPILRPLALPVSLTEVARAADGVTEGFVRIRWLADRFQELQAAEGEA